MSEALKFFLDPRMIWDISLILIPILTMLLLFIYFRHRSYNNMIVDIFRFGIWCSIHEKVYSGQAKDYFDADIFLSEPQNIKTVLSWFKEELKNERAISGPINRLAFVEKSAGPVGAISLKDLLCWHTKTPSAVIRPLRKGPALRVKFVHEGLAGTGGVRGKSFCRAGSQEKIILVSDVSTTGTTVLNAVELIEKSGGIVKAAFVIYDRQESSQGPNGQVMTAEDKLRLRGIRLVSMVKASELKEAALRNKRVQKIANAKGFKYPENNCATLGA